MVSHEELMSQMNPKDVATPDIALCGPEGHLLRQIFFGPKGTVTPLHYDPYENALCQLVGSKSVRGLPLYRLSYPGPAGFKDAFYF